MRKIEGDRRQTSIYVIIFSLEEEYPYTHITTTTTQPFLFSWRMKTTSWGLYIQRRAIGSKQDEVVFF